MVGFGRGLGCGCCGDVPPGGGGYCRSPCDNEAGSYVYSGDDAFAVDEYDRLAEFTNPIPPIPPWAGGSAGCAFGRAHPFASTYNNGRDMPGRMAYSSKFTHARPYTFTAVSNFSWIWFLTPYSTVIQPSFVFYIDRISGGRHIYTANTRASGTAQVNFGSINPVTLVSGLGYCLVEDLQTVPDSSQQARNFRMRLEVGKFNPLSRGFFGTGGSAAPADTVVFELHHASRVNGPGFSGYAWPGFDLDFTFTVTSICWPDHITTNCRIDYEGFDLVVNPEHTGMGDYWIKLPRSGSLYHTFQTTPVCPLPCFGHSLVAVNDSPTSWAYMTDNRYNPQTGLWTVGGVNYDMAAQRADYFRVSRTT